jgi:hypothetical protein
MKSRRLQMFVRGIRMALDPSMALRRRNAITHYFDHDDGLARDWYVVGGDLHVAADKLGDQLDVRRRVSSGA